MTEHEPSSSSRKDRRSLLYDSAKFGLASLGTYWGGKEVIGRMLFDQGKTPAELVKEDQRRARRASTYEPVPSKDIADTQLNLVGVVHTGEVFARREQDITQRIQKSSLVMLEYFNTQMQLMAQPVSGSAGEYIRNSFPPSAYNDLVSGFFGGVGSICAREGKDIVVVNPETDWSQRLDASLLLGIGGGLVATDVIHGGRLAAKKLFKKGNPLPRRTILRAVGYGAALTNLSSWYDQLEHTDPKQEENPYRWSMLDWRDAVSAQGIRQTTEIYKEELPASSAVTLFQGNAHTRNTLYYLDHPTIAEAKITGVYPQYRFGGDYSVRRYHYDKKLHSWQLRDQQPLR